MFHIAGVTLGSYNLPFSIAQIPANPNILPDDAVATRAEAALRFSGPQFFVALIAGLVLAFAFQLLLTNLSVAAGISYLGQRSDSDNNDRDDENTGATIRQIGTKVGIWTLATVTLALFFACLLAVKLSLLTANAGLGAILGLVIWGAYFSLLVWVSSTTVGSLIGTVVNTATSGFQAILGTATAAIGAKAVNAQVVATAEAAAAAVGRQLGTAMDPTSIRETLEDYLETLRPPELDVQGIRREFETLLNSPDLQALGSDNLRNINRQTFMDLVGKSTNLSKRDMNRIVDTLEDSWNQVAKRSPQRDVMGELVDYLKNAGTQELRSPEINSKLDELIGEMRASRQANQSPAEQTPSLMDRAKQYAMTAATGVLLGRTDLSDLDIQNVLNRLQQLREQVTTGAERLGSQVSDKIPGLPSAIPNTIRLDLENYLLNTYPWHFNRETIKQEFKQVIYDPEADAGTVRRQLEQLKRSDFVDLLESRGMLTQDKINEIADGLEEIRLDVLSTVQYREKEEKVQDVRTRVEDYLRNSPKEQLGAEGIKRDFKSILEDGDASFEELRDRLSLVSRDTLVQLLSQRPDITPEEANRIVSDLESNRDTVLTEAKGLQEQARAQAEAMWVNLESYLRNTGKEELNPEAIKRDLRTLLDSPSLGVYLIRARLSRFDRDTLVKLLSQRRDLSQEQANQIIDQVQSGWHNVTQTPQVVVDKTKEQYDRVTTAISDYLRNTGKQELNPEGIQRDLAKLFDNPKEGALALRSRLSQVDRDTLVKLLSQRRDLSEEEVNQIIDRVQDSIRSIVKTPRRLAQRTQATVANFQSTLEDYLRNTGKDALNPESIKRDLSLVLHDPRTGMESLGERLSRIDRDTVIALLSQRSDISEEEAARIVDQVIAVREQFVEQVRTIQRRIQDALDGIFARIRNYLNSLDRPELNYDGIKRDIRKLFDDPQAGFDALRYRLSQFNRDTLVAIVSSREDISQEDANRIIDQIEGARNTVLQRAERIQHEAQRRLEDVKREAAHKAEETRKAAETAAWWLFGTALVSAFASALAGAIAVVL